MLYIAKAIAAFILCLVFLLLGDEAAKGIDVGTLESFVVSLLVAVGVYAVPNAGAGA